MKFLPVLIVGGIIGAAQAVVMWGLFGLEFMEAAGWTLVIAPFGALLGVLATGLMLRL